jgi:hypothetical protein
VRRIIKGLALATIPVATVAALAGTASASVSNAFIGKGDVQTALGGINNATIQKLVDDAKISFSSQQAGSQQVRQALTQDGTQTADQVGTQAGTQTGTETARQILEEVLSCRKTNGSTNSQYRYGERDGSKTGTRSASRSASRQATRSASRTGSQTGSQSGTLSGTVSAAIDASARKTGQWTGWNVKSLAVNPVFATSGDPTWTSQSFNADWTYVPTSFNFGAYDFTGIAWQASGDYAFSGDYSFGATTWGDYVANPNEDPEGVCLKADGTVGSNVDPASLVHDISVVSTTVLGITNGAVAPGATTDGPVVENVVVPGDVHTAGAVTNVGSYSASGPVSLFVTATGYGTKPLGTV